MRGINNKKSSNISTAENVSIIEQQAKKEAGQKKKRPKVQNVDGAQMTVQFEG